MLRDLIKFRDLLSLLVVREIRIRYARAAMGAAWALFGPVVMMGVFTALDFGRLIPKGSRWEGIPYPVFAYVGLLFWVHFSTSLTQATPSLVVAADILRKSAFPREVIPISKVLAAMFDLAIGTVFLLLLMEWNHLGIPWTALLVPVVFVLQLLFTVGLAMLLSSANLFFRDVNYFVQTLLVLAMFATSVVYPVLAMGGSPDSAMSTTTATILRWNPMTSFLNTYRECLLLGEWHPGSLLPAAVWTGSALLAGGGIFRRLSYRFAEEV